MLARVMKSPCAELDAFLSSGKESGESFGINLPPFRITTSRFGLTSKALFLSAVRLQPLSVISQQSPAASLRWSQRETCCMQDWRRHFYRYVRRSWCVACHCGRCVPYATFEDRQIPNPLLLPEYCRIARCRSSDWVEVGRMLFSAISASVF